MYCSDYAWMWCDLDECLSGCERQKLGWKSATINMFSTELMEDKYMLETGCACKEKGAGDEGDFACE